MAGPDPADSLLVDAAGLIQPENCVRMPELTEYIAHDGAEASEAAMQGLLVRQLQQQELDERKQQQHHEAVDQLERRVVAYNGMLQITHRMAIKL